METKKTRQTTKTPKRAIRRIQRKRMIRHARSIFVGHPLASELQPWAEKRHDYLCRCSCYLCGKRRKHFGLTVQERRFYQDDPYEDIERNRGEQAGFTDSGTAVDP